MVFDVGALGGVIVGVVSAAAAGRSAAPVEKDDVDAVFAADGGEIFLGPVDAPVGAQIAAVFGAVGKAEHDRLAVAAGGEVARVVFVEVQFFHHPGGAGQIVDGFE